MWKNTTNKIFPACPANKEMEPSGFIGYKLIKKKNMDVVRIYLNCKDESRFEGPVDVLFRNPASPRKEGGAKFSGLDALPLIKKFNRFIGCLEERARDENLPRELIFESSRQLLHLLSRVKNSKKFGET